MQKTWIEYRKGLWTDGVIFNMFNMFVRTKFH